jgi:uncharacterized protein DUF5615
MIILLDENFPLRFYTRLQREGFSAEHILLTNRGIHDQDIMVRLKKKSYSSSLKTKTSWMSCVIAKQALFGRESRSRCK